MMFPFEIYLAILIACTCLVLLTVSFVVSAVYFTLRINAIENQIARLEGNLSELIDESQVLVGQLQQIAVRGNGVIGDVDRMTHLARAWSERANRVAHAVMAVGRPSMWFVTKIYRSSGASLNGVKHHTGFPDKNSSLTRSTDMSDDNSGSKTPQMMLALGAGALIGAGVAMLFAPRSGKATREMVAHKTNDLKDTAIDVIERGKHIVDEVKHEAHEAYEKGKKLAHEAAAA